MTNLQTPEILRLARTSLGISQATVSRDTEINRTYLSRFESGIQILPDEDLRALQDYYADQGYDFGLIAAPKFEQHENIKPIPNEKNKVSLYESEKCLNVIDGFLIPVEHNPDMVEALLGELHYHEDIINEYLNGSPKESFLGIDKNDTLGLLYQMGLRGLRCYSIVQMLQGHEAPFSRLADANNINLGVKRETLREYLWHDKRADQ